MKVLIIEDDTEIVDCVDIAFRVGWDAAHIISCGLGKEGIALAEKENPDAVILDLGLPDINGFEVLKSIRRFSDVPVIILTACSEEQDIVFGLELGANDYIVKPFKQMELLARIKANLRKNEINLTCYKQGPFELDIATRKVFFNGKVISLTPTESLVLQCLLRNAGQVVTYSQMSHVVWNDEYEGAHAALKVYIRRLRTKLSSNYHNDEHTIVTVVDVGYMLPKTW
ncbi:MAG: response regulator transcription factor [Chloroflexi bacterium]|nr:response regulator transcription factor [Chloroflexota bacterium]